MQACKLRKAWLIIFDLVSDPGHQDEGTWSEWNAWTFCALYPCNASLPVLHSYGLCAKCQTPFFFFFFLETVSNLLVNELDYASGSVWEWLGLRCAISGQRECQSVVALPALPYMAVNGAVRTYRAVSGASLSLHRQALPLQPWLKGEKGKMRSSSCEL